MQIQAQRTQYRYSEPIISNDDATTRHLLIGVSSFQRCIECRMEAYEVKRDPTHSGAGHCTHTYDHQHVWFDCTTQPDQVDYANQDIDDDE